MDVAQIKRIRTLKRMGVLADKAARDAGPDFLRYNLIYGFNGSGKSTLSRMFSCLQSGTVQAGLPEGSSFSVELPDGRTLSSPDMLGGVEERICVFNADFIERHLQWAEGKANSIFYISEQQAETAAELKSAEIELPKKAEAAAAAAENLTEKARTFATLKKLQAKTIAAKLHLTSRKYEAPSLQSDYETIAFDDSSILAPSKLSEYERVAASVAPPPNAKALDATVDDIAEMNEKARHIAAATAGDAMVAELKTHPEMVLWARSGHEYHVKHELESCLLCGSQFSVQRKSALAAAFNDALSRFVVELTSESGQVNTKINKLELATLEARDMAVMPELKDKLQTASRLLDEAMPEIRTVFDEIKRIYGARIAAPTATVEAKLPTAESITGLCERLRIAVDAVNAVVEEHNSSVRDFGNHQESARGFIRRHFLAEGNVDYRAASNAVGDAEIAKDKASKEHKDLAEKIAALRQKVRTHGPAADAITRLVRAYLGHGELTINAADQGYELHRHGNLVKGPPSEGEKTAIALCYFLSTLEADGRKVEDLVVVIDDPISSLDTKAMNYACALIRTRLRDAKQVFVLTHNQHCMNEFKKEWKSLAKPKDEKTAPTAMLLYLDVQMPEGGTTRLSSLVEMSKLLREYDSEYHFLCMKVLKFEQVGAGYSEYGYLMPHIIRRVLELFLAFKAPGNHPIKDKIQALGKLHPSMDKVRMMALERLCQVESHSDSMDDFIAHSSMTIEESRDANTALLMLMEVADENHTKAIRKYCKA